MRRIWVDRGEIGLRQSGQRRHGTIVLKEDGAGIKTGDEVELRAADGSLVATVVWDHIGPAPGIHVWIQIDDSAEVRIR